MFGEGPTEVTLTARQLMSTYTLILIGLRCKKLRNLIVSSEGI